jgi:hypothetical protein
MSDYEEFVPFIGFKGLMQLKAHDGQKFTVGEYLAAGGRLPEGLDLPLDTELTYYEPTVGTMRFEEHPSE